MEKVQYISNVFVTYTQTYTCEKDILCFEKCCLAFAIRLV